MPAPLPVSTDGGLGARFSGCLSKGENEKDFIEVLPPKVLVYMRAFCGEECTSGEGGRGVS